MSQYLLSYGNKDWAESNLRFQKNMAGENLNLQQKLADNNLKMSKRKRKDALFDKWYKLFIEIEKLKSHVATRNSFPDSKPTINFYAGLDLVEEAKYLFENKIADELYKMYQETYSKEFIGLDNGSPSAGTATIERNRQFTALFNKY